MSQVVIVIDVPEVDASLLAGHSLIGVGEDTARAVRKQLPVDDAVRLVFVAVGNDSVQHVVVDRLGIAAKIEVDDHEDDPADEADEPEWSQDQQEEAELREDEADQGDE